MHAIKHFFNPNSKAFESQLQKDIKTNDLDLVYFYSQPLVKEVSSGSK